MAQPLTISRAILALLTLLAIRRALAVESGAVDSAAVDALPSMPIKEGDTIEFDQLEQIQNYLPPPFWENRECFFFEGMKLEQRPKDDNHPYERKRMWVDSQAYSILYATAYDRKGELWKLIYAASRWTESEHQEVKIEGQELRAFLPVCNILVNPITGTGVRIELFDVRPTRLSRGKIRKQIDIGRLSRQGR